MTNPADQHIAELIENLTTKYHSCLRSEDAKRQRLIDQICQLRASMNPVIIKKKD